MALEIDLNLNVTTGARPLSATEIAAIAGALAAALAPQFQASKEDIMSALTAHLDQLEAAVAAAESRVSGDVTGMRQQIADLQAKAASGQATDAEVARLDSLTQRVAAIDQAAAPAPADTTGGATAPPTDTGTSAPTDTTGAPAPAPDTAGTPTPPDTGAPAPADTGTAPDTGNPPA